MKPSLVILIAFLSSSASAQGTFQNLNFEQANPMPISGTQFITTASAFPSWIVTVGGVPQTETTENDPSGGAPFVMLVGPGGAFGYAPIDGNYSVLLQGSFSSSLPSISQTGTIPAGTQSLLFEADALPTGFPGALELQIGTQTVPFAAVGTGPNYTLYGANISEWSGETEQLTFTALESPAAGLNNWEIDDISFSTTTVPEPSPLALTGVGGLLFALYRRFAPKRK
jgi:hypothetical protein